MTAALLRSWSARGPRRHNHGVATFPASGKARASKSRRHRPIRLIAKSRLPRRTSRGGGGEHHARLRRARDEDHRAGGEERRATGGARERQDHLPAAAEALKNDSASSYQGGGMSGEDGRFSARFEVDPATITGKEASLAIDDGAHRVSSS